MKRTGWSYICFAFAAMMIIGGCAAGGAGDTSVGGGSGGTGGTSGTTPITLGTAVLSWDPSASPDVVGYRIYYSTTSPIDKTATHVDAGSATEISISGLDPGTYHFAATAYDASNNESGLSAEASKTIVGA